MTVQSETDVEQQTEEKEEKVVLNQKNAGELEQQPEQQLEQQIEENPITNADAAAETVAEANTLLQKQSNPSNSGIKLFFICLMYMISVFFCTVVYRYVPLIGYVTIWLVPVIFALQTVNYGMVASSISLVLGMFLTEAFFPGALALQICIHYSILGITLGACFRKKI